MARRVFTGLFCLLVTGLGAWIVGEALEGSAEFPLAEKKEEGSPALSVAVAPRTVSSAQEKSFVQKLQFDRKPFTAASGAPQLRVSGADGRLMEVVFTEKRRLGKDAGSWQWQGKIQNEPFSTATLTSWKGYVFGSLTGTSKGSYEIRQVDPEHVEVVHLDESLIPPCGLQESDHVDVDADSVASDPEAAGTDGDGPDTCYVDIVVGYNDQARVALGGAAGVPEDNAAIEAKILTSVADANLAYSNSNVDMVMRLAWLGSVDYVYPPGQDFSQALNELQDVDDGNADVVPEKKALYQADFGCLWLANDITGGLASVLTSAAQKNSAYSVVRAQNPTSTFVHEVGHNMGCRHLRSSYTGTPSSWTPYAFAHSFTGSNSQVYSTVMASIGGGATRILYFSNPDITYFSTPTGVANSEDCARNLRENRATYEDFFDTPALATSIAPGAGSYTLSLGFGFVGETYALWRTTDLTLPSGSWTLLGTSDTDSEGNVSLEDTPTGLNKAFYQWRR
jgi:hypothetical protein